VWHYDEWSDDLFKDYINAFLQLKVQASGWPKWVKTEEDKEKFIRQYEEKEGIKLDPTQIEKNSGYRALAKLCLNS
jgi:hypothetical protein